MKTVKLFITRLKMNWYLFLLRFQKPETLSAKDIQQRVAAKENTKLKRGVKKMVSFLRATPADRRTLIENLIGLNPYNKTAQEKLEELRIREKIQKHKIIKSEDDLVKHVVNNSPIYIREQQLQSLRKDITQLKKQLITDPHNPDLNKELADSLRSLKALSAEVRRMKENR